MCTDISEDLLTIIKFPLICLCISIRVEEEMFMKTLGFMMTIMNNTKYRKHLHISYTRRMQCLSHYSTWLLAAGIVVHYSTEQHTLFAPDHFRYTHINPCFTYTRVCRDSVVGRATRYWLVDPGTESRFGQKFP